MRRWVVHVLAVAVATALGLMLPALAQAQIGHDSPGINFISPATGSGNQMTYVVRLPVDPASAATASGTVTDYAELSQEMGFSLPACDPKSDPQNPCTADSDTNIGAASDPNSAGSASASVTLIPPGYPPFIDGISCDASHWCAALSIVSVECTFGGATCNDNCPEPINFAFLETDGVPAGPPSPQLADASSFTPNVSTLMLNPGDVLQVIISDPAIGLQAMVRDLTTGQTGWMTASAANGFMDTNMADCAGTPFTFHAEYSTAAAQNRVPWLAYESGVTTFQSLGNFMSCDSVSNQDAFSSSYPSGQSFTDNVFDTCNGGVLGTGHSGSGPCAGLICQNAVTQGPTGPVACPTNNAGSGAPCTFANGYCFPAGNRTAQLNGVNTTESARLNACFDNRFQQGDFAFQGNSYLPEWPNGSASFPTPVEIAGPYDSGGNLYPQAQFESDVGSSESLCNSATGAGCTAPPIGAKFYPFWSLNSSQTLTGVAGGTCVWNFGQDIANVTNNDFGGDGQYGNPDLAWLASTLTSSVVANPALAAGCGAPVASTPPTIMGTAAQGQTVTEAHATWPGSPASFTYQWELCDPSGGNCSNITGANSQNYEIQLTDAGKTLRVQESIPGPSGTTGRSTSAATAPITGPVITTTVVDSATASPWTSTEQTGAEGYDTATIDTGSGPAPTGSVTYSLFDGSVCTSTAVARLTYPITAGAAPQSFTTGPLGPGDYAYQASYSGDSTYSSSIAGCEPFSVNPAGITLATNVLDVLTGKAWDGSEQTGAIARDSITVTGVAGFTPTGTIEYDFYDNGTCQGNPATSQTVKLDGAAADSDITGPLAAGSYSYEASYPGNSDYTPQTGSCEKFTVATAAVAIDSAVQDAAAGGAWTGGEQAGASAIDSATVTGVTGFAPTGTVEFALYGDGTCSGSPSTTETVGLIPGPRKSRSSGPLRAGSYSYQVSYSGDGNYTAQTGACEPFSVGRASVSVATTVLNAATGATWSPAEQTGATAKDTASITPSAPFTATGTVTYALYANQTCSGSAAASQTVTLVAGIVPASSGTPALTGGAYSYRTSYSGDPDYAPQSGGCESFGVGKGSASVATTVQDPATGAAWSSIEVAGDRATDTATVSGVSGITPTGAVTYALYDNGTCSGSPATTETVTLSGGKAPTSTGSAQLAGGTYGYEASYGGDGSYGPATGGCEAFTVGRAPAALVTTVEIAATSAAWSGAEPAGLAAQDTAKLTGVDGITPTGTVTYALYGDGDCAGAATASDTVALAAGSPPPSSATARLAAGSYSYLASYSGDGSYVATTGACEPLTVAPARLPANASKRRLPSNHFKVIDIHVLRTGVVHFKIKLPGGGKVTVLETAWISDERSATKGVHLLQPALHRFTFARDSLAPKRRGTFAVTVKPFARGKRLVSYHRYVVQIRLWVTFTPKGGRRAKQGFRGLPVVR